MTESHLSQNEAEKLLNMKKESLSNDINGPPHTNPDGKRIGRNHLHLYREAYGLAWAFEIPGERFKNLDDIHQTLEDFMRYCGVIKMPNIARALFT